MFAYLQSKYTFAVKVNPMSISTRAQIKACSFQLTREYEFQQYENELPG